MSKNKNKKNKKKPKNKTGTSRTSNPRTFFKGIGIKPLIGKGQERLVVADLRREIESQFGQETAGAFYRAFESDQCDQFRFCHSNLGLAKIWYGNDFNRICAIAGELAELFIPAKSRILDIGGGAGHLAFWMRNIWPDCHVTVADIYPDLGTEWAKELGKDHATFVDATLTELEGLKDNHYNVIVLSRVLSNINGLGLPYNMEAYDRETYFATQEAQRLCIELGKIADAVKRVMTPTGRLIVIEGWSSHRVHILCRAFDQNGLFINLNLFSPQKVGLDYSPIVFSRSKASNTIQDLPLGLSNSMKFSDSLCRFADTSAESVRRLFRDATPIFTLEYVSNDGGQRMLNELLEKEGLGLLYRVGAKGGTSSQLFPGILIPAALESLEDMENNFVADKAGKIIRKEKIGQ